MLHGCCERRRPRLGVLAILALVAGCTTDTRPEPHPSPTASVPDSPPPPTTVVVTRGITLAKLAFVLERQGQGEGRVRATQNDALQVTIRRSEVAIDQVIAATNVLLVFPLLRPPPPCVRHVELWLRLLSFDNEQAKLAAYPSGLLSLAGPRPTRRAGGVTLLDNRPRGIGVLIAGGDWMRFDVTGLYRTWAAGGPFPSQQRSIAPGTPLVLDVRAEDLGQPAFTARIAPPGHGRGGAPQLRWAAASGC